MQATAADLAFAAVCDLQIHMSENCKPKHIMIVIKCSKMMHTVTLHCYTAEDWLLLSVTTYDSALCLGYAQAIASLIIPKVQGVGDYLDLHF